MILDKKKVAGLLLFVFASAAAAGYTVFGGEREQTSLVLKFADGVQGTYDTQDRELRIILLNEEADRDKVICRAEGTDGKEKWNAGDIHWSSDTEGSIVFKRQGWYRGTVVYEDESYSIPEFCIETEEPEKPEVNTGSYKQGTWTNSPVHIKLSGGRSFSGLSCFEYKRAEDDKWSILKEDEITVQKNGTYIYNVRSVSRAGSRSRTENIAVNYWKRKFGKPIVSCTKAGSNGWYQNDMKISVKEGKRTGPQIQTRITVKDLVTGNTKTIESSRLTLTEEGKYKVSISQEDEAGNESKSPWSKKVFLDGRAPHIVIGRKPESKYIQNGCKIQVTIRDQFLDSDSIRWNTAGEVTNLRKKGDVLKADVCFSAEGRQRLSVSCKDQAGNSGESSVDEFFIDRTSPVLKFRGVSSFGIYSSAAEPEIFCSDESPTEVSLYLNGKLMKKETGKPGRNFQTAYPRLAEDGYYCAEVHARDSAGNKTSEKVHFTVSCKGTEIVPVKKTVQKNSTGQKETNFGFRIKNVVPAYVTEFVVNGRTAPYKRQGDYLYVSREYLKNGVNQVKIKTKDMTGHVNTVEKPLVFQYDAQPPVILVSGVRNGNTYQSKKEIQIKVQDEEDHLSALWLDQKQVPVSGGQAVIQCKDVGDHRLKIEAAGKSGVKSRKEVAFKIETGHEKDFKSPLRFIVMGIYMVTAFSLIFFFLRNQKS